MGCLLDVTATIVANQHGGRSTLPLLANTPESLAVFNAFRESVRQIVTEVEDPASRTLAGALWPSLIEFLGKGFGFLCVAYAAERSSIWQAAGITFGTDKQIRFADALAADRPISSS